MTDQTNAENDAVELAELRAENAYTWADVCCVRNCDHDGPRCGAWPELEAMRQGDDERNWSST